MKEKDLHRKLPSVRDIRTQLLHCSPLTPNPQLKQSFQTFAALPLDETRQQTPQTQTVVQDDLSIGSDRSGVIAKELSKSLILSAVSLDDAVTDPWMHATRYGRVDFAEVCCTSDSLLSAAVTSVGGHAVQYSHWNGFHLTTKARTDKLKEDLLEKKPRVVRMTPPCTTQRATISIKVKVSSNTIEHPCRVLWLVKQDLCETILEQMWGSTSLGRGSAFSELKEQFHSWMSVG